MKGEDRMKILSVIMSTMISLCYRFSGNYVVAIIIFTGMTKVILFPIALWTQRNSIKMVELMPELNRIKIEYYGDRDTIAEETQMLYKRGNYHPLASLVPMFIQLAMLIGVISAVRDLLTGTESQLSKYPTQEGGVTLLVPLAAGLAALILGLAQNHLNPLQREQPSISQWATNSLSIVISLALGSFVPIGVGLYWIVSNLFTIIQQLILNTVMPLEKYVDYETVKQSKAELISIEGLSDGISKEDRNRERKDYKRFFSVANKHLVFYSEQSGFYKYFQDVIEYLLAHSNIIIHYVTSDPKDQIFQIAQVKSRIRPYYIGEKRLITLMMKMDADMVVMTMPDLENFHIKRSYIRKDVEYVYMFHGIGSVNLLLRKLALAHYDTIFCVGEHQVEELREEEKVYHLSTRNLVPYGYGLLDHVMVTYQNTKKKKSDKPQILIAPSWQNNNILELCIDSLLESLICEKYYIILRPHPEYIKRFPRNISELQRRYSNKVGENFVIQTDFSSNETVFQSDLLITDWSTICYEFSFTTKRPTLFVDTPMKVMNPDYKVLSTVPLEIAVRQKMGCSIKPEDCCGADALVEKMLTEGDKYYERIEELVKKCLFNPGCSAAVGGQYILKSIMARKK